MWLHSGVRIKLEGKPLWPIIQPTLPPSLFVRNWVGVSKGIGRKDSVWSALNCLLKNEISATGSQLVASLDGVQNSHLDFLKDDSQSAIFLFTYSSDFIPCRKKRRSRERVRDIDQMIQKGVDIKLPRDGKCSVACLHSSILFRRCSGHILTKWF